LQKLGFTRATDLVGGFLGWAAAGLPVVSEVTRSGHDSPRGAVSAAG
jgi:hypothetical protein